MSTKFRVGSRVVDMRVSKNLPWVSVDGYIGNRKYAYVQGKVEGPDWRLDVPYVLVIMIRVAPSLQRHGVGTELLRLLKQVAGVDVVLATSMISEESEAFFGSLGVEEQ